ncbi:MAG: ImmA/IrrE family metallo-endopeptidase [Moorea sp. SIO2B7]|nr:ImmA/IrrE family metallo-endopeptidase [Moorena sp. SIO2B7]
MSILKPFRFIHRIEIEGKAIEILEKMKQTPNYGLKFPLDASRVAEFLGLDVVWDSIPADEHGTIAARILPLERLIEINEDIPKLRTGFGESTIAHEIGHWVLHINPVGVDRFLRLQKKGVNIKVAPLLCRSVENLEGIEWQAQYFASCLLMPQFLLTKIIQGKDLTKWSVLYQIADNLGVTISNLTHRLKDLDWIYLAEDSRKIYWGNAAPVRKKQMVI